MTATEETDATAFAPPVVVVVVSRDPGPWLEESLASIGAQDYRELSVLVIDAGSEEPILPRVADVLPAAFVRRLDTNPGFGPAANEVLNMVEGALFYAFCHDDVVLDPNAIRALVEEAYRSNAGVIGPKLVIWDDPSRLLQVGMAADKGGVLMPLVEHGELDQEQHDAVRDVFVVPGACTMVRSDLFATLGGFDPAIDVFGEDLDLCWRAQVAGARVLVAPAARARHREGQVERIGIEQAGLLRNRHRLRTVLTCYGRFHRLRVLPQLALLSVAELVYAIATRNRAHVRRVVGAWWWNLQRRKEIRARRQELKKLRRFPDSEVRKLQVGGSARIRRFVRGELASKLGEELEEIGDELEEIVRHRPRKLAAVAWGLAAFFFVVGTRSLILHRLPSVAGFAPFDLGPMDLFRRYLSGWQPAGIGSAAAQPTGVGVLGVLGSVLLGHMGILQQVLVLGAIPAGAAGMWRLTRPLDSPNARGVGLLLYAVVPLPWNGVAQASWAGLVLYGAAPWLLTALSEATGDALGDGAVRPRPFRQAALALGLVLAVVAAFVPLAVPLLLVVALAVMFGGGLGGRFDRLFGPLALAAGAAVVTVALHLPWAIELVSGDRGSWAGVAAGSAREIPIGDLMRFETGPVGISWLGWSIPIAAALVLVLGRSWRFRWGLRCWSVALSCWALAIVGGRVDIGLPPPEVLLAPAAAALALAAALGVSSFEHDLRGFRFGWRQAASIVAGGAVALAVLPIALGSLDGSWHLRSADHALSLRSLAVRDTLGGGRVLWIGAPESLPVAGYHLGDDLDFALTTDALGGVLDRWATPGEGPVDIIRQAIDAAEAGGTDRLGTLLAPFGVRYVVLVDRPAPERTGAKLRPVPTEVVAAVEQQLDLQKLEVEPSLHVFRNITPASVRTVFPDPSPATTSLLGSTSPLPAALGLTGGQGTMSQRPGHDGSAGPLKAGAVLLGSPADDRWRLTVDGTAQVRADALGWASSWVVPAGRGSLSYETSPLRYLVVALQAVAWAAAAAFVFRRWRRRR